MDIFQGNGLIQNQQFVLSPKMLEELKILQMSNIDLMQYIEEQMEINPVLELDENMPLSETEIQEKEDYLLDQSNAAEEYISADDFNRFDEDYVKVPEQKELQKSNMLMEYKSRSQTLSEYILSQLGELSISEQNKRTAFYLIYNLDDKGYLCVSLQQAAYNLGISLKAVKEALKIIWDLEPVGVGARNLKECLLIQLYKKGLLDEKIKEIVMNHLKLLGERRYKEISERTGLIKEEIIRMHGLIKTLNPKPGKLFESADGESYIKPELEIKEINGCYMVVLTRENLMNLRVSSYYRKLIGNDKSNKETDRYIKNKLNKAIEIINAVEQRNKTILNIASFIVDYQTDFLRKGHKFLKPLTLKLAADNVGMHESTVSRTVNNKYITTPRGIFELKYFFSSQADSSVSANGVKKIIYELVKCEDPSNPMSDDQLRKELEKEGITVARRTIAKYRAELNILPALMRK